MSEKAGKDKLATDASKSKSKDKGKEKDKNVQSVEWDSNKSSSNCVLCKIPFGVITNRRHHCRNCGRLVCEACSSRRFKLSESSNELPQRVCDTCHEILNQKREMKIQVVQLKDKNLELMLATSVVSDSLINLFYLDGSTKTIGIDETTTISELANLACSFMSIALFEVVQNIQSASQYKMLLPNQNVLTLIDQWEKAGQPYIKIVMPINNPTNISLNNYHHNNLYPEDAFNSRESFASMSPHANAGRESVMNRSSMLVTSPMALPPSTFTSPSPGKSIYKIKQSSVGTNPVFMSSSADLMATSLESRSGSLPPSVPPSPGRRNTANNNTNTQNTTTTTTTNAHAHNPPSTPGGPKDDNSSRNSSISEAPSGTDGGTYKSHSNSQILHIRDPAAMLVASQVQVHSLQVLFD